jgi:hypothetical protein
MDIIYSLIIILSIFLLGYGIGRRVGKKEGYEEGIRYAPITLRKEILKTGDCPFCKEDN